MSQSEPQRAKQRGTCADIEKRTRNPAAGGVRAHRSLPTGTWCQLTSQFIMCTRRGLAHLGQQYPDELLPRARLEWPDGSVGGERRRIEVS